LQRGWYIKPLASQLPSDVTAKINELFPSYGDCDAGKQLLKRFSTIPCLLISSWFGKGMWDEERGKNLKKFLSDKYPAFYRQCPTLKLLPAKLTFKTPEQLNRWLCKKANLSDYKDLTNLMPETLEDIQFNDGVKAKDLSTKSSPQRPKIRFASLDTLEGKRLFEIRNNLRAKGKTPAKKRVDGEKPLARFLAKHPQNVKTMISTMWLQAIAVGLVVALGLWACSVPLILVSFAGILSAEMTRRLKIKQQANIQEAKLAFANNKKEWMQENKSAYELGNRSKNWLPYLQSYFQLQAYTAAYQIGLENAPIDEVSAAPKPT
jgi:hypothetical protein